MKAKKSLLLVVLTLALLAVALILPAAAFGKSDLNKPVSWVSVGTNTNRLLLDSEPADGAILHAGTTAKVQKLADGSVRGEVVVKVFRELWALDPVNHPLDLTLFNYVVKTSAFTFGPYPAYAEFFFAAPGNWPEADLGLPPGWWFDYEGAAVADFVAYVPVSEYPELLPWVALYLDAGSPVVPYRFMFIDSDEPGRADVMLNWLFVGFPTMPWMQTFWAVPITNGNIQVHVGVQQD